MPTGECENTGADELLVEDWVSWRSDIDDDNDDDDNDAG